MCTHLENIISSFACHTTIIEQILPIIPLVNDTSLCRRKTTLQYNPSNTREHFYKTHE